MFHFALNSKKRKTFKLQKIYNATYISINQFTCLNMNVVKKITHINTAIK